MSVDDDQQQQVFRMQSCAFDDDCWWQLKKISKKIKKNMGGVSFRGMFMKI